MLPVVLYDANVLYPSTLRDVLIRVGLERVYAPRWTEQILDELFRNLRRNRPDLDPARLDRTRALMNTAIPEVLVTGYEHRIDDLVLPDPDDRHVLAAAIHAGAQVIVTKNLKDFPPEVLVAHDVVAQDPDDFLLDLHGREPRRLLGIVHDIAATWRDDDGPREVVEGLAHDAPSTADVIRRSLS